MKNFYALFFLYIAILLNCSAHTDTKPTLNIAGFNITPQNMAKMLVAGAEAAELRAQRSRTKKEHAIQELEQELVELGNRRDRKTIGKSEYEQLKSIITQKITFLRNQLEAQDRASETTSNNFQNILMGGWNTLMENYKEEQQRKTQIAVAAASKAVENEGRLAQAQLEIQGSIDRLRFMSDPSQLKNYALFLGGGTLGIAGSYYGAKLVYGYVQQKLEATPNAVLESSFAGVWDQTINKLYSFFGYEQKPLVLEDNIVFTPEIEDQLRVIANITRMTHEKGLPHQSLLLHGPPGTGKTWFATLLARTSGMDYAITSADRFAQFAEGKDVQELHTLLDWAERSPRGMIIFVDEIDALGSNRDKLDERWIRLQNAFLARTGKSSASFKIIGATNRLNALDPAFMNRFPQKLLIPLPGIFERERLFNLYIKKYIAEEKREIKQEGKKILVKLTLAQDVDAVFIKEIAHKTDNFAGRDIEQAVDLMRSHSYLTDNLTLTRQIVESVIEQKIKSLI